jgi:uncharacterized protein YfaQ (DUF2300 family)
MPHLRSNRGLASFRYLFCVLAVCSVSLSVQAVPQAQPVISAVELVMGRPDAARAWRISAEQAQEIDVPASAPLGSLWKLFVYAYLADRGSPTPDYHCTGQQPTQEVYCCEAGDSIDRDRALAKSCGLYFSPQRLGLSPTAWKRYWQAKAVDAPAWLTELDALDPATVVPVSSILAALASIDERSRQQTMRALQGVTLEPRARALLSHVGAGLRVKTWSWHDSKARRIGGFAGWLADGTPVWLRGAGSSASIIEQAAPWLEHHIPPSTPADEACVQVRFFSRYPLAEVEQQGQAAAAGPLREQIRVLFRNEQSLQFVAKGDMRLTRNGAELRIDGRFGLNDYVARVIQREAAATPTEAARALGVAARTYLARHADFASGCYHINDDSRSQRVSAAAPGQAARAAADWSDGLILNGVVGRYHQTQSGPKQLSWKQAVSQADAGARWDEILQQAYGGAGFGLIGDADAGECQALEPAQRWLLTRQASWRAQLSAIPGFEAPSPLPQICRLVQGNPYADLGRGRIYATGIGSLNERLTITHEYLHFALANHPRGREEDFVERTARSLLGTP